MPTVYYGYNGSHADRAIGGNGSKYSSFSSRQNIQQTRQAQNGNYPAFVTGLATYGGSLGTSNIYYVTGPDVEGDQTSDAINVNSNSQWWFAGGVGTWYGSTPSNFNFYIYLNNGSSYSVGTNGSGAASGSKVVTTGSFAGTYSPSEALIAYNYQQVPSPPNNLRAYSSGGTFNAVDLYWDGPSDWGDSNPTGYDVYIAGIGRVAQLGLQNSFTVGGLNGDQGYTFYVAARNGVSDHYGTSSTLGNPASAAASNRPGGVYNLSAYQDGYVPGRINLYWGGPGGGSASQYIDYYIYVDGQGPSAVTRNTSYTFDNMGNWQYHSFFIVAANQFGGGPNGNTSGAVSPGVPSAVYNLSATASPTYSGRINISWSPPAQTSGGIVRYTIYQSNGGQVGQVDGNTTSMYVENYTPGTSYPFDVRAWNQWGVNNGQFGDPVQAVYVTADGNSTAPGPLTPTSVSDTIGKVHLSWSAPSNSGIGPIRFYNIYEDGNFIGSTNGDTQVDILGRSTNTNHVYWIAPRNTWNVNNNSVSPRNDNAVLYVPGVPSAPRSLGAVASTTTAGLVSLAWTVPATIGGTAGKITRYVITRTNGDGTTQTYQTTNTNYDVPTTPKSATSYYVVAYNDAGDAANTPSAQSNSVSTTSNGGASAPTYLTITPATNTIARLSMTWLPPAGDIVSYTINRSDGTTVVKKTITGTRYTDDTVLPGQTYTYQIQATNTTNTDGDLSAPVSAVANTTSSQGVANLLVVNNTNTALSGDFTINSTPAGTQLSYRQTTPNFTLASVPTGFGTLVDKTNVFLNGQYYGTATTATQIDIAKPGTPFSRTAVTGGTLTDNTNVALNGNKTVTAINPATKAFSYAVSYMDTSQRPAAGTIRNYTNEVFNNNGNPITITSATSNSFTYYIAGANVTETTATGSALDITNRDFFNGHYTVSAVLNPTTITYERVPQNMRAALTNYVKNPRMETAGSSYTFRTNLCTNPSFEVDLTGWTAGSAVSAIRSTAFANTGTASMLITKSALEDANSAVSMTLSGLTVGGVYTISGYFKAGNGNAAPYFSVAGRSSSNPITLTSTWQRTSYTFTANATSHTFNIQAGAATVATSNFYVDSILIENTLLVSSYFDGSYTATDDHSFSWSGTANASTSIRTAVLVNGVTANTQSATAPLAVSHRTTSWYIDSTHSLKMITMGAASDQHINITNLIGNVLAPNKTYTIKATFKTDDSIIDPNQIYVSITNNTNSAQSVVYSGIIGTPGVYTFSGTFTTNGFPDSSNTLLLWNRTGNVGSTIYVDSMMIVDGDARNADTFNGYTTGTSLTKYAWTGTPDNSTSTRTTDLSYYSGGLSASSGGVARSDNPAGMDIFYRSGWLG